MKYWTDMPMSFPSFDGTLNRMNFATAYSSLVGFSCSSYNSIKRNDEIIFP